MRPLALAALLAAPAASAASAAPATEAERSTPVPAGPARPYQAAPVSRLALANGLKLALVESARLPVVALELALPFGGSALEPQGREGLAGLVAALMTEGAGRRDASAFSEAVADLGARVSASADADALTVRVFARKESLDKVLALVSDMVRRPALPASSLERLRAEMQAELAQKKGDPGALAEKRLYARVFSGHPYGRSPDESTVGAITRADAAAFAARAADPRDAVLSAAGDVSLEELKALAERHFRGWKAPGAAPALPSPLPEPAPAAVAVRTLPAAGLAIDLFDLPGSEQSAIRVGHASITRDHPDFYAVRLMMEVLGGGQGRLQRNIREAKGWAYGAYAFLSPGRFGGSIVAQTDVQTDRTADAVREIFSELDRMREEPVGEEELLKVKNYASGAFLRRQQKVQGVAGQTAQAELLGLPADEPARYRERLMAVTAEELLAAARRHLRPDAVHVVIAGDAAKVYEELARIAPVKVYGADGAEKPAPVKKPSDA